MNQEQNPFDEFISSLLEEIMAKPGYRKLDQEEQKKIQEQISDHFREMVLDTLISRLNEEQRQEISGSLEQGSEVVEAKITKLASGVPGFLEDVEERLRNEAELFKSLDDSS